MFDDYKWAMQMEAEEIAEDEFGVDFYDLPQDKQLDVYQRGMDRYRDKILSRTDELLDRAKENS